MFSICVFMCDRSSDDEVYLHCLLYRIFHSDQLRSSRVSLDVQKMMKHNFTGCTCVTSLQCETWGLCELGHPRNDPSVIESVIS